MRERSRLCLRSGSGLGAMLALAALGGLGALSGLVALSTTACNEFTAPLPAAPDPLPPPPASRFNITGHWEAMTDQGRRIAFDVSEKGVLQNGRINLHHDCNTMRLRMTIDGYETQVSGDSFDTTLHWRIEDPGLGLIYTGKVTVSGRFESNEFVRGGFINSVTDVRDILTGLPTDDVCPPVHGTWEGGKE